MKSYFIEGLQGAGKSTYVSMLEKKLSEQGYTAYREGDYSLVELAWCTYMTEKQYEEVLEKYAEIAEEIKAHTYTEDSHRVVCYTRIITDVLGFHKDMEQYEIYNGNISRTDYENIILKRFGNIEHLKHRQDLEIQILENVFDGRYQIVKSRRF